MTSCISLIVAFVLSSSRNCSTFKLTASKSMRLNTMSTGREEERVKVKAVLVPFGTFLIEKVLKACAREFEQALIFSLPGADASRSVQARSAHNNAKPVESEIDAGRKLMSGDAGSVEDIDRDVVSMGSAVDGKRSVGPVRELKVAPRVRDGSKRGWRIVRHYGGIK
ncbi:hypothetical protein EDD85DRAFT_938982 [Armillaria nabsnona]|nr:hypothetical protein EDD85DRAFT_938982 [Armillaria nabsnona]